MLSTEVYSLLTRRICRPKDSSEMNIHVNDLRTLTLTFPFKMFFFLLKTEICNVHHCDNTEIDLAGDNMTSD